MAVSIMRHSAKYLILLNKQVCAISNGSNVQRVVSRWKLSNAFIPAVSDVSTGSKRLFVSLSGSRDGQGGSQDSQSKSTRTQHDGLGLGTIQLSTVHIEDGGKSCTLTWEDGFQSVFHSSWLRHNCHCKGCRHENGQRLLSISSLPPNMEIDKVDVKDGNVEILWKTDTNRSHRGILSEKYLRENNYNDETLSSINKTVKIDKAVTEIPTVEYEGIVTSKEERLRWLRQINEAGISIVKGVPLESRMVQKVGELIAPIWDSIYGLTFDVVSQENPINVAYSNLPLDYHMDLVYFESPPGLQLLHCIRFDEDVEGGYSTFLDVYTHAEEFRIKYPEHFHTLTTVPATFQKVHYDRDYPVDLVNQKPHIKLNHNGEIVAVYWAPTFEGPLCVSGKDVERYYAAYELFASLMETSPHQLTHKLSPGDCLIFNNIRLLHGRTTFKGKGQRHLQGCYINIDFFKSQTQVLTNLYGDGRLVKRVGNQCWR